MGGYLWCYENHYSVKDFLRSQIPEYHPDSTNKKSIEEGKGFDVMSLISGCDLVRTNGEVVPVDSLKGKNIAVCCVFVPVFWLSSEASQIQGIPTSCSRIFGKNNYEIVMVLKMRNNWIDDEDAFNHFLSGFPASSCLAIPFSDTLRRDYVCKSLGLVSDAMALLVDTTQKVVLHQSIFQNYRGFLGLNNLWVPWHETRFQLDALLDCKPSDFVYKISPKGLGVGVGVGDVEKVSISKLKEKLVGLYLCYDGGFIRTLSLIHQECKARNLEFEIVLVYIPIRKDSSVNPQLFQENFPELHGKRVIELYGMFGYPFTRKAVVLRLLEELSAFTLESFLVYGPQDYILRRNINSNNVENVEKVPVAELRGKTVLLCFEIDPPMIYEWYNRTKRATYPDLEVVFVNLSKHPKDKDDYKQLPIPWLTCPFDPEHVDFLLHKLNNCWPIAFAFGKDGKIISSRAEAILDSYGPDGFPCDDGRLCDEVVSDIKSSFYVDAFDDDMYV
ncbi:probable nucleoredoxin 1-2 [Chenopodium quinoa]|uniref:probable nucleoredoxin 1-2 n=1 Tax=Chenopodium quinoa TaxID=63459 RepID=UPI000B796B48|nr:probable nucleoredoxin 1-2 [Chenopodium quinoa]